ncbi:hypothetical protein AQUCO_00500321v1 [Aquilegia coerulea]|uniref:Beta-amylase n=1 Tax=Aquilegia coerulea TaxID=218851 RepID=A0A2G5ERM0_AQUCA|nr:hypothetical protein AQUCO_00500321v1 [Aquilegia coerulea]
MAVKRIGGGGFTTTCCKCSVERRRKRRTTTTTAGFFHRHSFFKNRNDSMLSHSLLFTNQWGKFSPRNFCIFSMNHEEKSGSMILETFKQRRVPIFVMMPIDALGIDTSGVPKIRKVKALTMSLKALKLAGVHGITVEVWWGIVERSSPFDYNWSVYEQLFTLISGSGLKLHVALSFHSNVESFKEKGGVSLPLWILEIGRLNRNIYYKDQNGFSSSDYLTLGVDQIPLFHGRTALQCYEDFMYSFIQKFETLMGSVIEEVSIGLGPSGELRYPAHPSKDGRWEFPGIGEFQCYDKYMLHARKDNPSGEIRVRRMQAATTAFHLVFLSLKMEEKAFFLIMANSFLNGTVGSLFIMQMLFLQRLQTCLRNIKLMGQILFY